MSPVGGSMGGISGTSGMSAAGGFASTGILPDTIPDDPCAPRASYHDLFVELLGKTESDVDAKLDVAFQHFFHGSEQQTIYYESGDEAYILDVNNSDVRSEGMSYGMMVAVQLDKQTEFDRLWAWAKNHMQQSNGYFAWQAAPSGQIMSTAAAPDGEEYFATALVFAAHRWGSSGRFDYASDARNLLNALRTNGAFNTNPPVVKFLTNVGYSDPSYVLPGFYQVWACFDTANAAFWQGAVASGRSLFHEACHPDTGLAPYLSNFDGTPNSAGPNFNTDAWRVVANVMADYHWFREDGAWQARFARTYATFFANAWAENPAAYEFTLNGDVLTSTTGSAPRGLVAQNALVAFAAPPELGVPALQAFWNLGLPSGQYRYYDGMLYLLALLHASGNFRLY